ncbi:hypothetical protein [Metapseudomonas resinovorans]|uniref:hypothetical protein n=1 Tax=Metapseudomonas resinovorans TaxID=53412 RepID=UPI0012DE9A6B|nr:hypothetical protein [Pseudomonas resinovorans]
MGKTEWRDALVPVLRRMRAAAQAPEISNVIIDFSNVTQLHPCGTLLFLAEIERLLETPGCGPKFTGTYPQDEVVEQLFQHVGLLSKLGLPSRIPQIDAQNVVPWLYVSGHEGDLRAIPDSLPRILTDSSNQELRLALLSGMAEAVANSSEHAYIKDREGASKGYPATKKKWWLFARQVDEDIAVVICDLGAGIPGTLESNWKEEVRSYLKTRSGLKREHHKMIELAFTVGKTRTNEKHRGKGLKDILKVVRDHKVGSLGIYSNKGVFSLDNAAGREVSFDEKLSIVGTVIQWSIPIEAFGLVSEQA